MRTVYSPLHIRQTKSIALVQYIADSWVNAQFEKLVKVADMPPGVLFSLSFYHAQELPDVDDVAIPTQRHLRR